MATLQEFLDGLADKIERRRGFEVKRCNHHPGEYDQVDVDGTLKEIGTMIRTSDTSQVEA